MNSSGIFSFRKQFPGLIIMAMALTMINADAHAWTANPATNIQNGSTFLENSNPLVESVDQSSNSNDLNYYQLPLALSAHDHFLLARPLEVTNITWPTSEFRFGYRVAETNSLHSGLDIGAKERTPVLASGPGEVVFAGYGLLHGAGDLKDPYGIAVKIKHSIEFNGSPIYTIYAHLSETRVKTGDLVTTGQTIGLVGMTGNTTGPHLHYEVRIQDERRLVIQNPEMWLVPALDYGVLAGRIINNMGNLLYGWKFRLTSLETGREWIIQTYDPDIIAYDEHDPYYQENYVLNDLPSGSYEIGTWYNYVYYKKTIEIIPGVVNYINFNGKQGFQKCEPPGFPNTDFLN